MRCSSPRGKSVSNKQKQPKNNSFLYIVAIGLIALMVATATSSNRQTMDQRFAKADQAPEPSPTATRFERASDNTPTEIPPEQVAIIETARLGLVSLAAKSATAQRLLQIFTEHSAASVYLDQNRSVLINAPDEPRWFILLGDPTPRSVGNQGNTVAAQFFCSQPPRLLLYNFGNDELFAGLMAAHELSHADACLFRGEPEVPPMSPVWLAGEMYAHATMQAILKETTDGKWSELMERSRVWRAAKAQEMEAATAFATVSGHTQEEVEWLKELFPEASDLALGVLLPQLEFDATQMHIYMQAKEQGLSEDAYMETALRGARGFYNRPGIPFASAP